MMNRFELSHGRLAANGDERGEKVVSPTSLETLKTAFVKKLKELYVSKHLNVLDQPNSRTLCYLWEHYDEGTYQQILSGLLQTPDNICRFVSLSASRWTGSGVRWTFSNDYTTYISKEKALKSIHEVVASPIFATLSQDLKEAMAAFVLWNKNEDADADERTSLPKVHALLKEWENEKK